MIGRDYKSTAEEYSWVVEVVEFLFMIVLIVFAVAVVGILTGAI